MKHADHSTGQVCLAIQGIVQLAVVSSIQAQGHGVDRKVAPAEIVIDGGALDRRERAGLGVGLCAGGDQVKEGRESGGPAEAHSDA